MNSNNLPYHYSWPFRKIQVPVSIIPVHTLRKQVSLSLLFCTLAHLSIYKHVPKLYNEKTCFIYNQSYRKENTNLIIKLIETVYAFLWGDLFTIPVMGSSIGISLMLLLLIPAGIYFTIRTRGVQLRLLAESIRVVGEKSSSRESVSAFQALMVSTASRERM